MDESANTPEHDPRVRDPDGRAASEPTPVIPAVHPAVDPDHEIEDDGPLPRLDADVEQRVRSLLVSAADPGPMPDEVSERISGALLDAARLRVDPGPLSASASGPDMAATGGGGAAADGTVLAMPARRDRPKPIYLVAAVAAAAAVVAVGASALHVTKRPNGAAVVGDTYGSGAATSPSSQPSGQPSGQPSSPAGLHIQAQHDGIHRRHARHAGPGPARRPRPAAPRPRGGVTRHRAHRHAHRPRGLPRGDRRDRCDRPGPRRSLRGPGDVRRATCRRRRRHPGRGQHRLGRRAQAHDRRPRAAQGRHARPVSPTRALEPRVVPPHGRCPAG